MEIKKRTNKHVTTQYTINYAKHDYEVTEMLGGEEYSIVAIYDEDTFCVALFRMLCCRGVYDWGGQYWCIDDEERFAQEDLNDIALYIIQQHNINDTIFNEMTN